MEFYFKKEPGKKLKKKPLEVPVTPKVSVITPFYNAGKYFEQTYRCLINQMLVEFEWIIVNDGSTKQEDVELLKAFSGTDTRIRLFHQKNGGQSKAKNYGISQAKTEIIVFLDADDLVEDFYLEVLYQALEEHPNAAWSYTDLVGFAAEEYVWCKTFSAGRMTFNNILVNAAAFRKRAIEKVGGFPEIAKHYDEDWALYLRLLGAGFHPVQIPVIGFWYRKSATGMQQTVRKDENLRVQSDKYIRKLAKKVNIHIKAETYHGTLPKNAVKSAYGKADKLLAKVMNWKLGVLLVKIIYNLRK